MRGGSRGYIWCQALRKISGCHRLLPRPSKAAVTDRFVTVENPGLLRGERVARQEEACSTLWHFIFSRGLISWRRGLRSGASAVPANQQAELSSVRVRVTNQEGDGGSLEPAGDTDPADCPPSRFQDEIGYSDVGRSHWHINNVAAGNTRESFL
ncbi:hypothetical protein NDU88_007080 [Pleurodeles waltl]|uniref:Uncharacterized protein n=1 Tax=Pleurodeles waltl TaxID=8319 RepID=A0AAV7LUE4_PLEWA|nr:hypothetical protein NDU88_007080 [Pleurodeles waltl]